MMKFAAKTAVALGATAMLAACGGLTDRNRPDEFAVQRQAPLIVPPDFDLQPPQPGAPRPTEGTAAEQALRAMFPAPDRSGAETSALIQAGEAEPGIRSTVGDTGATFSVDKGAATRTILAAPEGDGQGARSVIPG